MRAQGHVGRSSERVSRPRPEKRTTCAGAKRHDSHGPSEKVDSLPSLTATTFRGDTNCSVSIAVTQRITTGASLVPHHQSWFLTAQTSRCPSPVKFTLPPGGSEMSAANFWGGRSAARPVFQRTVCSAIGAPTNGLQRDRRSNERSAARSALQRTVCSAIDAPTNGLQRDRLQAVRTGSSCVARWHLVLQVEFPRDGTGHRSCRFKSSCTFLCDKQHPRSTVLWDVAHNWLARSRLERRSRCDQFVGTSVAIQAFR